LHPKQSDNSKQLTTEIMGNKVNFLLGGLALVPCAGAAKSKVTTQKQRPNVIYIFPDQFRNFALGVWSQPGYRERLGCVGDPVHTPNLDAFAREAVVLTSAMSNCPLSSPHRGSLLTGMYPNKSGVPLNCNSNRPISSLRKDATCIGDVFSQNGYDCAYIGKLHADFPTKNDPQRPGMYVEDKVPVWDAYTEKANRHGFNYWYAYGTFDEHKNPHYWDNEGVKHEPREWSPLHEAKVAMNYIKNKGGVRNKRKPFFMMIAMNPPHSPYRSLNDCMEEDYNVYRNKPLDSLLIRPNANRELDKAVSARYYFASVTGVDRMFGYILKCLKEQGLDKNTIVIFSSDHGETMCSQNTDDPKNSPYRESMNVPFMVRYPGKVKPRVDDLLLSSPDIMPTVLGLAGLEQKIPQEVQGKDYSSIFFNNNKAVTRPDAALYIQNVGGKKNSEGKIISYFPSARGLKTARYTFAIYITPKHKIKQVLLFDDVEDPYQMRNIPLTERPDEVKKLCKQLGTLLKDIDDPWYKDRILADMVTYP